MKVITVGNSKGGVGKSTICVNLAVAAAMTKKKVLIIDADTQGSSMGFRSLRETDDIAAMAITTPTIHKNIADFSNFDLIFIDAGGRDSTVFRSAIAACDLMIIPVLPSVYDIWAASETVEMIKEVKTYKDFKSRLLLNQLIVNTIMAKEAEESLDEFKEEAPVMNTKIYARAAFKNSIMKGQGVLEYERKSKASYELASLYNEMVKLLK